MLEELKVKLEEAETAKKISEITGEPIASILASKTVDLDPTDIDIRIRRVHHVFEILKSFPWIYQDEKGNTKNPREYMPIVQSLIGGEENEVGFASLTRIHSEFLHSRDNFLAHKIESAEGVGEFQGFYSFCSKENDFIAFLSCLQILSVTFEGDDTDAPLGEVLPTAVAAALDLVRIEGIRGTPKSLEIRLYGDFLLEAALNIYSHMCVGREESIFGVVVEVSAPKYGLVELNEEVEDEFVDLAGKYYTRKEAANLLGVKQTHITPILIKLGLCFTLDSGTVTILPKHRGKGTLTFSPRVGDGSGSLKFNQAVFDLVAKELTK